VSSTGPTTSKLDRDVAIKVLPAASFGDQAGRARLLREARTAAALNHPNICTIHEVGEAEGLHRHGAGRRPDAERAPGRGTFTG